MAVKKKAASANESPSTLVEDELLDSTPEQEEEVSVQSADPVEPATEEPVTTESDTKPIPKVQSPDHIENFPVNPAPQHPEPDAHYLRLRNHWNHNGKMTVFNFGSRRYMSEKNVYDGVEVVTFSDLGPAKTGIDGRYSGDSFLSGK